MSQWIDPSRDATGSCGQLIFSLETQFNSIEVKKCFRKSEDIFRDFEIGGAENVGGIH